MATSLMALSDVSDNGLRICGSKLKFGHAAGSFPQHFQRLLNAYPAGD